MPPEHGSLGELDALDRLLNQDIQNKHAAVQVDEHVSDVDWMELGDIVEKKNKNVAFTTSSDIRNERAENQGIFMGLANGVMQTAKAFVPRVLAAAGEMLDIPDYFNGSEFDKVFGDGKDEYGNFFSNWIRENVIEDIEKNNAVYKYDDTSLLGSSPLTGKWWKNFTGDLTSIAGSATEFAGAGFGVGSLISKGLRIAGMIGKLGKTINGQQVTTGLERLLTATATNQAEALGSAADVHQRIYDEAIANGETANAAADKASIAAATTMNMNRANIMLNLSSVGVFGMGGFSPRAWKESAKLATKGTYVKEGAQEFFEEVNNFAAEKAGEEAARTGKEIGFLEATFSPDAYGKRVKHVMDNPMQALEAGVLGALGGVGQTAFSTALASDRTLNSISKVLGGDQGLGKYAKRFLGTEVIKFDDKGNPKEKRDEEGNLTGYETEVVSKATAHKRHYDRQRKLEAEYNTIFGKEASKASWDFSQSLAAQKELQEDLMKARKAGDTKAVNQIKETILQERAYQAFESGTAGVLIGAMESELNKHISEEERINRNLPEGYKEKLQEGINMVQELEKTYVESKLYKNSGLVYNTKASQLRSNKYKNAAKLEFNNKRNDFNSLVADAIADGKLTDKAWATKDDVESTTAGGKKRIDTLTSEQTIEGVSAGDYAAFLSGELDVKDVDSDAVTNFLNQVQELFPTEMQEMGELAAEIHENTELEYIYRMSNNKLKSKEMQDKAVIAEEEAAVEQEQQVEEASKQAALDNERNEKKQNMQEDAAKAAIIDATKDNNNINEPDFEQPSVVEDQPEFGNDTLDGGYDPDTTASTLGDEVEFTSQNKKNRKAMNLTSKPTNTMNETLGKDKEKPKVDEADAHKQMTGQLLDKIKDSIDRNNLSLDPLSGKKLAMSMEALTEIAGTFRELIEHEYKNQEPAWAEVLELFVKRFGEDWTQKAYPYITNAFGFATGQVIGMKWSDRGVTVGEVNDIIDIHNKVEEEIDEDMYTVDTQDQMLDQSEEQTKDVTHNTELYEEFEQDGGKPNKTWTGHNILAYLAIDKHLDKGGTQQDKEAAIRENMKQPLIMSTKHFIPNSDTDTINIEINPDRDVLVTNKFRKGAKTTYGQLEADAADTHGVGTDLYNHVVLSEMPMLVTDAQGNPIADLHGVSWITAKNVSQKFESLKDQRQGLRDIRAAVITAQKAGKKFTSKILEKTSGKLIYNKDKSGAMSPVAADVAIADGAIQLTVATNSGLHYGEADSEIDSMAKEENLVPGGVYAMLPVPARGGGVKTIASPIFPNTISREIANGIELAINAFMDDTGEYDQLKKDFQDTSDIDLNTEAGLETFLKQFLYTLSFNKTKTQPGASATERFVNYTDGYKGQDKVYIQMINGVLYMRRGSGYALTDSEQNAPKIIAVGKNRSDWKHSAHFFKEMLMSHMHIKVQKEGLNSNEVSVWNLTPQGGVDLAPNGDYNAFVKQNSKSITTGINIGTEEAPDYIYTVQNIIEFDTNPDQTDAPVVEEKKKEEKKDNPYGDEMSKTEIAKQDAERYKAAWQWFSKKFEENGGSVLDSKGEKSGLRGVKKGKFVDAAKDKRVAKEMWNKLKNEGVIITNSKGWAVDFIPYFEAKKEAPIVAVENTLSMVELAAIEEARAFLESTIDQKGSKGIAKTRSEYIKMLRELGQEVEDDVAPVEESVPDVTEEEEETTDFVEDVPMDNDAMEFFEDMQLGDLDMDDSFAPRMLTEEERTDIGESLNEILITELGAVRQTAIVDNIASDIISKLFEGETTYTASQALAKEIDNAKKKVTIAKAHITKAEKVAAENAKSDTKKSYGGRDPQIAIVTFQRVQQLFGAIIASEEKLGSLVDIRMKKMKGIKVNQKTASIENDGTSDLTKDQMDELSSFTTDSKKTVGANVRRFLGNLKDKNYNGNTGKFDQVKTWTGSDKIVPFDEVFNTLSALLEGIKPEYTDMITVLKQNRELYGWIDDLVKKLERAGRDKETTIQNEFVVAMSKHQIKMKFVFWEYKANNNGGGKYIAKVTDSNQAALGKAIQNSWFDGLMRSGNVVSVNGVKKIDPVKVASITEQFEQMRNYSLENPHGLSFEDVRFWYTKNQIKVGEEFIIDGDKIPESNPLYKHEAFPTYVSLGDVTLKLDMTKMGDIAVSKLAPELNPAKVIQRKMLKGWLKNIGIDLDERALKVLATEGMKIPGEKNNIKLDTWLNANNKNENNPFYHLYNSLKQGKIQDLDNNRSIMIHKGIKALAALQAKYEKRVFSNSFQAGKKSVFTYTANKYATDRLRDLKTSPALIEELMKIDFSKASLWMKDFVTSKGKAKGTNPDSHMEIGYVSLQALKQQGAKNRDDKSLLDISPADHEYYKMALMFDMQEGKIDGNRIASFLYPTVPATKSTRFVVKNKAFETTFKNKSVSKNVIDTFYKHVFMAEYKRILHAQQNPDVNIKEYDAGSKMFHFLPKLNVTTELWGTDGKLLPLDTKGMRAKIKAVIKETIDDAVAAKVAQWDRFGFTKGEEGKKKLKYVDHNYVSDIKSRKPNEMDEVTAAAYDFEVNQMLATVNMFQMFVGDPAMFHKVKSTHKLGKQELVRHFAVQEWMKAEKDNVKNYAEKHKDNKDDKTSKWNTYDSALSTSGKKKYEARAKKRLTKKDPQTKESVSLTNHQMMLEMAKIDPTFANQWANEMVKEVFNNVGKRLSADVAPGHDIPNSKNEKVKYLFLSDRESQSMNYKYLETLGLKGLTDYKEVEGTDAQEYTTWEEHLDLLERLGKISKKKHKELHTLLSIGEELNDELLKEVLQPMKPVYTGNIPNTGQNFERRMYIKTSSFPLLPQLTKGLEIDKLRKLMQQNKVKRAVYKTGVKIGMPSTPVSLYNKDGSIKDDISVEDVSAATLDLPRANFRIQMEVPYKESKNSINVGTQERKLLFTNIRETMGFEYGGKTDMSGRELEVEYNKLYNKVFKMKYDKLRKRLVDQDTGKLNKQELQKLLKEEAEGRGYPLADLLGLDTTTNSKGEQDFVIPLWANPSHKAFESLMISVIQNNINKMKFNGGSFVTGSEEGFNMLAVERDEDGEIVEGGLEAYDAKFKDVMSKYDGHMAWTKNWQGKLYPAGEFWTNHDKSRRYTQEEYEALEDNDYKKNLTQKVLPNQVLMPSKIRGRDGHLINMKRFVDPKTGKIDQRKMPKELLEFFQFRIPTQGHNSMSWSEVVGFLPPESGDLLIVSRDLTIQKGLDFDVDKEYAYFYGMKTEYDAMDAGVLQAKADYAKAYSDNIGDALIQELNTLKVQVAENEWYDKDFKDDRLSSIVLENLDEKYHAAFNKMTPAALKTLNRRTKTKHRNELTPISEEYSGATRVMMLEIKAALQQASNHYNTTIKKPRKRLREIRNEINYAKANELKPFKDALQAAKDKAIKFKKIGSDDDVYTIMIDSNEVNPITNEAIKIRVKTNNAGEILNEDELKAAGLMDALSDVYPDGVHEGFKAFAEGVVSEQRLQNKILDIHKQVLLHPEVQKYIHEPLSFGDLKGGGGSANIAQKIFDMQNANNRSNATFTPMSSEFQRDKLTSGLAGSMGIGVFSLDSVFLSQLQNKGVVIKESVPVGDKTTQEPVMLRFGDKYTTNPGDISSMGLNQSATGTRFDTIAAFQSAAVDNENEQILDKINSNKFTFDFTRAMALLGFDEKLISVFQSQDSILHYVDQMQLSESEVSKAFGTIDFDTIIDEYEAKHKVVFDPTELNYRGYPNDADNIGYDELFNMIKDGPKGDSFYKTQAKILRKFKFVSELGAVQMKKLQGVLKADSSGFGANFLEIAEKYDNFLEIIESDQYDKVKNMIGDFVKNTKKGVDAVKLMKDGYIPVGPDLTTAKYYVKPTTVMGQSLIYGLQTANQIFKDVIPYTKLKKALSHIHNSNTRPEGEKVGRDLPTKHIIEMFDDLKSYIFSHDTSNVIVSERFKDKQSTTFQSIIGVREQLLKDKFDAQGNLIHASLATILNQLKNSDKKTVENNAFLSRLTTREGEGGINLIEFNAAVDRGFDDTPIYAAMADLLNNKRDLGMGIVNGSHYNTTQLAQDLITYSYAMGGVQGATNFMRYVPIHYLKAMGFDTGVKTVMNNMFTPSGDPSSSLWNFYDQWIRNNPDKAIVKQAYRKNDAKDITDGLIEGVKKIQGRNVKHYIVRERGEDAGHVGNYISVPVAGNKMFNGKAYPQGYALFVWDDTMDWYVESGTVGMNTMKEYDAMNRRRKGMQTVVEKFRGKATFKKNNITQVTNISPKGRRLQTRWTSYAVTEEQSKDRHMSYLESVKEGTNNPTLNLFADFFKGRTDLLEGIQLTVNNELPGRGMHNWRRKEMQFNEWEMMKHSEHARSKTIIHEYVHTVVDKYLAADSSTLTPRQAAAVASIQKMHADFVAKMKEEGKYDLMILAYNNGSMSKEQVDVDYAAFNTKEFMTLAMTSRPFQQYLMEQQATKTKTFWEKLVDVLTNFLKAIGMEEAEGTQLAEAIENFMILSDFDMEINVATYNKKAKAEEVEEEVDMDEAQLTDEEELNLLDMMLMGEEEKTEAPTTETPTAGLGIGTATRETIVNENEDEDFGGDDFFDMGFQPKVGNHDELAGGFNKATTKNKLYKEAKKLIAEGRLEFDCKKK